MRYILHLGLPKTATTSLQKSVFPQLPRTELFVRDGPAAILGRVRYRAADAAALPQGENWSLAKIRSQLLAFAPASGTDTILISNENIVGRHPDGMAALVSRIGAVCPEASVMIVLRKPIDFLQSIYRQEINNYVSEIELGVPPAGQVREFDSFARQALKEGGAGHLGFLHYDELMQSLTATFDDERVLVLDFASVTKDPEAFLRQVVSFTGATWHPGIALGRENISAEKLETILEAADQIGLSSLRRENIRRAYQDLALSPETRDQLAAYFLRHAGATMRMFRWSP